MSGFSEHLPPPSSGSSLEISFRRLLRSSEEIVDGDSKGRSDLEDWARSPVFHANVETLQEQLADLESLPTSRIEPLVLHQYREHVNQLASKILPIQLPAYFAKLSPQERSSTFQTATAPSTSGRPPKAAIQDKRGSHQHSSGIPNELRQRAGTGLTGPLHHSTHEQLDRNKNLQDTLTDEMVALAAGLKKNAQAMQRAVDRRGGLLDETETAIDDSLARAKRSSKESQILKIKGSMTFCGILLAIFVVSTVFVGTYIFIKTTSFVGYKARPRV